MRKLDLVKVERYMRYLFIFITSLAVNYNLYNRHGHRLFMSIETLVLFILPSILIKRSKINISAAFQIVILLFIFGSMYLGELNHYYYRIHWWDTLLHGSSSTILAYIGFLSIYTLNRDKSLHGQLSPFFMALFIFCFSVTVGSLWEIFEYVVDIIWGSNMQKARGLEKVYGVFDTRLGVIDTMRDLIVNTLGALLVSVIGYFHIKHRKDGDSAFWGFHRKFVKANPELFDK